LAWLLSQLFGRWNLSARDQRTTSLSARSSRDAVFREKDLRNQCCKVSGSSSRQNDRVLLFWRNAMKVPNHLNFDAETYLLFCIYYAANGITEDMDESAATYLATFAKEIETTGQVLQWLGLATPDEESPLGSKPSHQLVRLIVRPRDRLANSRRLSASDPDEEAFGSIFDLALENVDAVPWAVISYVERVLGFVELLDFTDDGGWILTQRLIDLVVEARFGKDSLQLGGNKHERSFAIS
jgi:hypothetical protein